MNKSIAIAVAAALVAGGAVAAWQVTRGDYAEVVEVEPITESVDVFAHVLSAQPITQMVTGTREVCEDHEVLYSSPDPRDPNRVTGTVAGAVIGGVLGNQVGGGSGRRLATVAGAAGGAVAGREIQGRQQQGQQRIESRSERVCRTESAPREQVIGYDVSYELDGEIGTLRSERKPGERMAMGQRDVVVAYDVTYRYDGRTGRVQTISDPGRRLPVRDGVVMVPAAPVAAADDRAPAQPPES